jgi:endoglucanase
MKNKKLLNLLAIMLCLNLTLLSACASNDDAQKTDSKQVETEVKQQITDDKTTQEDTDLNGATSMKLLVQGTDLTDASGKPIQLKGISTHGLAWFPQYVNKDCFASFQKMGANVIRLAMYTGENGGYCSGGNQTELINLVDNGVDYATELGMYVIIDWHILSDNNPRTNQQAAIDFFSQMSSKYKDYDNVIYEICNEPNGGTSWSQVKEYANAVIPAIRANTDAVILVGTPQWCQQLDPVISDPITGYDNVMYTLHFYAATHKDDLRNQLSRAHDAGLPVFVSEYGICDSSGNGNIDEASANAWVQLMNSYNISYVCWNLSNKNESSSVLNSGCDKISDFTESDLSTSGRWLMNVLASK